MKLDITEEMLLPCCVLPCMVLMQMQQSLPVSLPKLGRNVTACLFDRV